MHCKSLATIALLLAGITLCAQDVIVKGILISDDNIPVDSAEVSSLNSGTTTSSDKFGRFELTVSINQNILITKAGFLPHQQTITSATSLVIQLKRKAEISTGYQELLLKDLPGSGAALQQRDFNSGLISSPELLIQGKVAGVRVTLGSGEPGSDTFTYIRGVASLQGSEPLFVIDGFPLLNDDPYGSSTDFGRGTSHPRDPLNFINPLDIERIDVLKDEASSAIYGSRGGNGVILIKTKTGVGVKNQLQFNSQFSLSSQQNYYDLLNKDQFLTGLADRGGDPVAADFGANTDWQREINRSPLSQKYDLSYSSTYKSGNYRISFGYDNQQGVIQESGVERLTGTAHWNHSVMDNRLKINGKLSFSKLDDRYSFITTNAGFQGDLLGATYSANPSWTNDPEFQPLAYSSNPLSLIKYHEDQSGTNTTLFNLSGAYELSPHLTIGARAGINQTSSTREAAISPTMYMANGVDGNGRASIKALDKRSDLVEATIQYTRTFTHAEFTAVGGYAFQTFSRDGSNIEGWGFSNPNLGSMIDDLNRSASIIQNSLTTSYLQFGYDANTFFAAVSYPTLSIVDMSSNKPVVPVKSVKEDLFGSNDRLQSFFINLNYNILSEVFITGSLRVDGSTLFGSNHQYGIFPSIAASWRLSEESFIPDFFSDLKVRASYGKSGNQHIPHGARSSREQFSIPPITMNGEIPVPGLIATGVDNPDLKWEEMTGINFGIDVSLAENKFRGSIDVYKKTTTDFLFYLPLAQPSPLASALANSNGKIINSGVELALDQTVVKRNNLNVTVFTTIAYNTNTLKDFPGALDIGTIFGQGVTGSTVQQIHNNQPLYSFFLPEFKGYDTNGISIYDGVRKIVGEDPIPNLSLAFGCSLNFKNWDATILFSGLTGYSMYNNTANAYFTSGSLANARNVTTDVLTSSESSQNFPEASTRFLEDADFLRLQNIMVGRNFYFKKGPFKLIRGFLAGQNLVMWTNYSGPDPDVNTGSMGIDYSTYPKARVFTIGVQANF